MEDDGLEHIDAPEPIETEVAEAAPEVEEEQKAEETASESSPDTVDEQKQDGVQKKIDKLTKKQRAAERDAAYWREQALKNQPQAPVEPAKPEPIKTLEDFGYDEAKYQQHLFEQARKDAVNVAKAELQKEREQATAQERAAKFNERIEKFSDTVDDFDEVVRNENLSITQVMADAASEMETGAEVLYHLGKNPDVAREISRLSPFSQAREMGRIEATLAAKAKSGETVSKAPGPAPKLAAGNPSVKKSLDELEGAAYNAARRKYIEAHR